MRDLVRNALSIVATGAFLTGCGGSQPPIGAPDATPSPGVVRRSRSIVRYVYVTNYWSGNVSAYVINTTSGALTKVKGSPFAAGRDSIGVATDPMGSSSTWLTSFPITF